MVLEIKNNNKLLKKILLVSLLITILLVGVTTIYIYSKSHQKSANIENSPKEAYDINSDPATDEQKKAGNQTKASSSDKPPEPINAPNSDKKIVPMTITAINQNDNYLQIRSMIGAVDNNGLCTITLTDVSGNNTKETAEVQSQASVSTCKGFDIPISKLSKGQWNIKIDYSSDQYVSSVTKYYQIN